MQCFHQNREALQSPGEEESGTTLIHFFYLGDQLLSYRSGSQKKQVILFPKSVQTFDKWRGELSQIKMFNLNL